MVFNGYRQSRKKAGAQEPGKDAAEIKKAEKESGRWNHEYLGCIRLLAELGRPSVEHGRTQRTRRNQKAL